MKKLELFFVFTIFLIAMIPFLNASACEGAEDENYQIQVFEREQFYLCQS